VYTHVIAAGQGPVKLLRSSDPRDREILTNTFRASNDFTLRAISALVHFPAPKYTGHSGIGLRGGSDGTPLTEDAELETPARTRKFQTEQAGTEKLVAAVRESIIKSGMISLPDPDSIPADAIFRVVEFGPTERAAHGSGSRLHPAPNPDLLRLRNLDAECNRAYKNGELAGVARLPGVSAAFSVACLDLDPRGGSCMLCRHHVSLMSPELVEPFAADDWEALEMSESQVPSAD
jgi:hypothetical protein